MPTPPPSGSAQGEVEVALAVNGTTHRLPVDPRTTLFDALRDRLHLTGTKKGCALGQCGACTVLLDGRRIVSCLTLAVMNRGRSVTTIESLAEVAICGVAPAIANAVYHATGRRIRDLPITPDRIIE